MILYKPINLLKKKLDDKFIRNIGWLGGSELIIRIFRLITTVILARFLNSYDYGMAAIVMTVNDFVQVFSHLGITAKIIQADPQKLDALCNSAYWLNWIIFLTLFCIQCIVAFVISFIYNDQQLILPIVVLALIYLILPFSTIQEALILRENRLRIVAITNSIQVSVSNILTAIFAFLHMGMWSIVLPAVLVAPIWVYIFYNNHSWRLTTGFSTEYWKELFNFGKNFLGAQLLKTLRNNLDYLIVGRFLGIKELGIYYFAFNAGLGISLSIINALNSSFLPHLCAVRSNWVNFEKRYFSSLKTIGYVIVPWVLLQSSLAPLYVPIIFGQKWIVAIPVLVLICLSAITRPFADAASYLLVAVDKPNLDLRWNILFTVIFTGALLIGLHWQTVGVATSVLLVHLIFQPLFVFWATRYVFHKFRLLDTRG